MRAVLALGCALWVAAGPALAGNPMGYRLLSEQEAAALPRAGSALGLVVDRGQQITDDGMTFDVMQITRVSPGSAGEAAGFHLGDEIIAVDGRVFPTIRAFAGYVGSVPPGQQIRVDSIPRGGGPKQAQRVSVTLGRPGEAAAHTGLSTGAKVAIGVGAVALLGCYELGCFKRRTPQPLPQQPGVQSPAR